MQYRVSFTQHKCVWSLLLPFASYHLPTPWSVMGDWRTKTMLIPPDNLGGHITGSVYGLSLYLQFQLGMAERAAARTAAARLRGRGWEFNSSNARPCVLIRCGIKITGGWLVLKLKCLSSLSRYPHLIITLCDHIEYPWPFYDYIFCQEHPKMNVFFSFQASA